MGGSVQGGGWGRLPNEANCVLTWQRCDSTQAFDVVYFFLVFCAVRAEMMMMMQLTHNQ